MMSINQKNNKPFIETPSTSHRWRFGDLPASEWLPHLRRHLFTCDTKAHWQLVWLNNNGNPVIGILPKTSWTVYLNLNNDKKGTATDYPSNPYKVIKNCRDKTTISTYMSHTDWQNELIAYSKAYEKTSNTVIKNQNPSTYHHGLIGFIGYDMTAHELSPSANIPQAAQPCALLGHYDIYLSPVEDNHQTLWQLTTPLSDVANTTPYQAIISKLKRCLHSLDTELNSEQAKHKAQPATLILKAQWHKSDYQHAFAQTQRYLVQGDCYQINLTQAWQGYLHKPDDADPHNAHSAPTLLEYLPRLHANTQAPFAGYLENTDKNIDFELLSCSPELFFTFIKETQTQQNYIRTKPIKGTMPRGTSVGQDAALKQQLIDSEKDRSENVMIVDLLRNDLGKYAKVGSVKVPQLFAIESFSNVHHMVSTITAELKADTHPLAVLFGSLPAGSITGTPKKRAVEIISELEDAPRGAYCGTLGYMNFDGSGQWNVLIRTLQAGTDADNQKHVSLWAGGGITIASDCDAEYQECLDKVGNLLEVLAQNSVDIDFLPSLNGGEEVNENNSVRR